MWPIIVTPMPNINHRHESSFHDLANRLIDSGRFECRTLVSIRVNPNAELMLTVIHNDILESDFSSWFLGRRPLHRHAQVRRCGSGRRVQHTKLHTATTGQTPHTIRKGYGVALGLRVGGAAHATQRAEPWRRVIQHTRDVGLPVPLTMVVRTGYQS